MNRKKKKYERFFLPVVLLVFFIPSLLCGCSGNDASTAVEGEYYQFDLESSSIFEGGVSDEEVCDYSIIFRGDIESFSNLSLGKGKNEYSGSYINITKNALLITNYALIRKNEDSEPYHHDFKPKDYISIIIEVDNASKAHVTIDTNGMHLQYAGIRWDARQGKVFVESNKDTVLSN